jgi:hypothetical protein
MKFNPWSIQVAARLKGMKAEADTLLHALGHNGARGAAREIFVKDFLAPFLPPNVGIGTGEIINHRGARSKQVDVVLYNRGRLPPVLIGSADLGVFPWECVIATIEVKSSVDAGEVRDAVLNAYSIRRVVHSLIEPDLMVGGKKPLESRAWSYPIPAYIFAFDTDLQPKKCEGYSIRGAELERLFEQRKTIVGNHNDLLVELERVAATGVESEIAKVRTKLKDYQESDGSERKISDTSVRGDDLLGICVLNREWAHGHIEFRDSVPQAYTDRPIRTVDSYNFHWSSVMGDGEMTETLRFLGHLLFLAHEMPRCFENYSLDRYLDGSA